MALYRGVGGAGDATNDATSQSILAAASATQAAVSASDAAGSATSAATSATNAANSATSAANSATTATTQATNASTSATNAATSASSASTSATNAATSETNSAASASLAQDWATKTSGPVAGGEYSSKYHAQLAATSATNASNSATSASTSAFSASNSATNAANSATSASNSASAASTSATNAAASETNAASSASSASNSATSAANSATTAATQASNAASSATAAATSASNASTSETNAANSASTATTQATNAANSASAAATSETNAANSATSAAASYDSFDDRYLGSKTSDPSVDNAGNVLLTGALYWNSVANEMRVWGGSSWLTSYLPATSYVQKSGDTMTGTLNVPSLTSSGDVTLSGGTANGVAYLNSSKVLTTGSALTFDGTAFTTTGSATAAALIPSGATVPTNGLFLPDANTVGWATNSAERMRLDSSGNLKFDSGYGSVATAYGCRAWVNFNGSGTVAIRDSGNVSSITDNGTGDYKINFTNAMPDTNYSFIADSSSPYRTSVGQAAFSTVDSATAQTTSSVRFGVIQVGGTAANLYDSAQISVAIFR